MTIDNLTKFDKTCCTKEPPISPHELCPVDIKFYIPKQNSKSFQDFYNKSNLQ